MKNSLLLVAFFFFLSCSKSDDSTPDPDPSVPSTGSTALGKGQAGAVGIAGIEAWDKLAGSEKDRIKGWNTIFMHQSVGAIWKTVLLLMALNSSILTSAKNPTKG